MSAREAYLEEARGKPLPPYTLDAELTFFCPQENLEGLELPVVREFLAWARESYRPAPVPEADRSVLLLMPCQKTKPYPFSSEHLAINRRLVEAGFRPDAEGDAPGELRERLEPELVSNAPLIDAAGTRIDRAVISEPFAFVPYEAVYRWRGAPTPCARYDDPGLFEERRIEPTWRSDCTARDGRWGDRERAAYVEVHNRMAEQLHAVITRIRSGYDRVVGYVAPGLTHRTFLADAAERLASGMDTAKSVDGAERELVGVNDLTPGLVEIVPDGSQLETLKDVCGDPLPADVLERRESLDLLVDAIAESARD